MQGPFLESVFSLDGGILVNLFCVDERFPLDFKTEFKIRALHHYITIKNIMCGGRY